MSLCNKMDLSKTVTVLNDEDEEDSQRQEATYSKVSTKQEDGTNKGVSTKVNSDDKFGKAGFSHTGNGERALCFDCYVKPRPEKGEDLLKLHKEISPDCKFVKEKEMHNSRRRREESGLESEEHEATSSQDTGDQDRRTTLRSKFFCEMCHERHRCMMFRPCNHHYSCEKCAEKEEKCKRCGSAIEKKVKTYRS